MEATQLKEMHAAYDNKLDKTLRLNTASIEKLQRQKSQNSTNRFLRYRIFEVVLFACLALSLGWYTANNWDQTHLAVSGIIFHIVTLVALAGSIGQVVLLQQVDYSKPVVAIRKKIEYVNAHGLLFVKLVFLSAPVWWSYVLVGFDFFFGLDVYVHLEPDFVVRYLIVNLLLIVPLVWFLNKLSYKKLHIKWVRKTLGLFTNSNTLKALEALSDIKEFEK